MLQTGLGISMSIQWSMFILLKVQEIERET